MPSAALRVLLIVAAFAAGCSGSSWNNPYSASEAGANVLYSSFIERPKHLDPAQSYTSDEYDIIQQIYEPPLQYHYLKRPYELVAAAATEVPKPRFFDERGRPLPRSEEHTSELQSRRDLVCRLLLEKKK